MARLFPQAGPIPHRYVPPDEIPRVRYSLIPRIKRPVAPARPRRSAKRESEREKERKDGQAQRARQAERPHGKGPPKLLQVVFARGSRKPHPRGVHRVRATARDARGTSEPPARRALRVPRSPRAVSDADT